MTERRPLAVWGAAGHALVVADIVRMRGEHDIVAFLDDVNPDRKGRPFAGASIVGGRDELANLRAQGVEDVVLAFGDCPGRLRLAEFVRQQGFSLVTLVHPATTIAVDAVIGPGCVIVAGSVINPRARLGANVIVNTGATVDHECVLDDAVHLGPGVHLGGRVTVGTAAWVGIGAVVKDGVRIGAGSIIGAGAVVLDDIPAGVVAYGTPARAVRPAAPRDVAPA
jgi:acetyltransferase EpsM